MSKRSNIPDASNKPTPEQSRCVDAPNGEVDWIAESRNVDPRAPTRIIVGRLEAEKAEAADDKPKPMKKPARRASEIPDNLAELFPFLTHLYLWNLPWLRAIPALPAGLKCLDVRGCPELTSVADFPADLDTLVMIDCPSMVVGSNHRSSFQHLEDLSIRGSVAVEPSWLDGVLGGAPALRKLDASNCSQITRIAQWSPKLVDIRLDGCTALTEIDAEWPPALRRIGLRGATALRAIEHDLSETIDYVDLARTPALKRLPLTWPPPTGKWPRTLFLHGSGVDLPAAVLGDSDGANVAQGVLAHLEASSEVAFDHEIKVFVLGNGRCGKTSLAKRVVGKPFDPDEPTTHPISLWSTDLPFTAAGESKEASPPAHLNIWDFAGQELYHNMHRRFLELKAVYVLCHADPRLLGADAEGDKREKEQQAKLPRGAHFDPGLGYWKEQVASLVPPSGAHRHPPTILVATKVDHEEAVGKAKPQDALEFDAKTRRGLPELLDHLSACTAEVLGRRGERNLGRGPMKVKQELRRRKQENEAGFEKHLTSTKSGGKPGGVGASPVAFAPPHPFIARDEFDALVREHCPGTKYAERPELLLQVFHVSGFVFALRRPWDSEAGDADERGSSTTTLTDIIVLDQRWVLEAVYALFDRERCWPHLVAARGRFCASDLRGWAWRDLRYSEEDQARFIEFMVSSEICFELVPAGRTVGGEAIYLVPAALPERTDVLPKKSQGGGVGESAAPDVVLGLPEDPRLGRVISRDVMLRLLVRLGRRWRRMALLWCWGGRFESFLQPMWKGPRTFVELDWKPHRPDSYAGVLTLTRDGPDRTLLDAMRGLVRDVLRKEFAVDVDSVPELAEARSMGHSDPFRGDRAVAGGEPGAREVGDALSRHAPGVDRAVGAEIAISYAGVEGHGTPPPGELPDWSIEKWPRMLEERLKAIGFAAIAYDTERKRPDSEKTVDNRDFPMHLASRDLVVAVLSEKYLKSPWCMMELFRAYELADIRTGTGGDGRRTHLIVAAFPEARINADGPEAMELMGNFVKHWSSEAKAYMRQWIEGDGRLPTKAYHDWMAAVMDGAKFTPFCNALARWAPPVNLELTHPEPHIGHIAGMVAGIIQDPDVLFECARRAYDEFRVASTNRGRRDEAQEARRRAALLLGQALAARAIRDGRRDGLEGALDEELGDADQVLDDLRAVAATQEEMRTYVERGWCDVAGMSHGSSSATS